MRSQARHYPWQQNLAESKGLSDLLNEDDKLHYEAREVTDNLYVLTSGRITPNPVSLINSQRMASLVEYFTHDYDFVIFDSPSLLTAIDAILLARMTDGIILVSRPGIINAKSAIAAKDTLKRSSQNVLGLSVNGVSASSEN